MNGRIVWMDHVRGAAILLVVLFHAQTLLRFGYTAPEILAKANAIFSPYRMPILAFISGFIAYLSFKKPALEFIQGKVRHLAWPYIVWSIVYAVTVGATYSLADHELYISYLWYLGYIFCYYFASWTTQSIPRIPLILVAFALAAAIPEDIEAARRFFFLWGIFMLGELAHNSLEEWSRLIRSPWVFLGLIPMATVTIPVVFSRIKVLYDPLWLAATLAGVIVACAAATRLDKFSSSLLFKGLAYLGRNSVVYYTSHFPIIWGCVLICSALGVNSPWPVYMVGAFSALLAGTALAFLSKKVPFIALLFRLPSIKFDQKARHAS